jgi:hypothetical protein
VSDSSIPLDELLDLKMLPAGVNEPAAGKHPVAVEGGEQIGRVHSGGKDRATRKRPTPKGFASKQRNSEGLREQAVQRATSNRDKPAVERNRSARRSPSKAKAHRAHPDQSGQHEKQHESPPHLISQISVRFLPHPPAQESVIAQIKQNAIAYSVFELARLFLAKPERYNVRLTASAESPFFQLGENGAVSLDRQFLERNAFRLAQSRLYKVEITEGEPIKGNFSNVARCKLTGRLLGPTNHHDYQKHLRSLFEQRFSRRMSFADYQRQVEIVSDPSLVEQWKEEARKITTYSVIDAGGSKMFASAREAEHHFRENYLPGLIRTTMDLTIDGPSSRRLPDRALHRFTEDEWSRAIRSPSYMMQELAERFRQAGLHIFRHRRGMLFVSPIRTRPLVPAGAEVSASVKGIIETLGAAPRISRKELAEKLIVKLAGEDQERAKLALASDLHWLIHEGYVIEFNDGSLDLPRAKTKPAEIVAPAGDEKAATEVALTVNSG